MLKEIILSIKYAESKSEEIIDKGVKEARKIVIEANNQAYKLVEQSIENAESAAREILKKAEAEARLEAQKQSSSIREENLDNLRKAKKNLDKAADLIVERVVKAHGYN